MHLQVREFSGPPRLHERYSIGQHALMFFGQFGDVASGKR